MFKLIAGILLFVCGIAAGIYVGLWWAFVGGIILFVEGIVADPVNASWIAYGVVRVMLSGVVGYLTAIVAVLPSLLVIGMGIDDLTSSARHSR